MQFAALLRKSCYARTAGNNNSGGGGSGNGGCIGGGSGGARSLFTSMTGLTLNATVGSSGQGIAAICDGREVRDASRECVRTNRCESACVEEIDAGGMAGALTAAAAGDFEIARVAG